MIKIIDTDKLFEKFAPKYISEKMKGLSPKQIEERIDELFTAFGDEAFKELDDKTPNTYYKEFDIEELVSALSTHLSNGVEPPVYLCDAIAEKQGGEDSLIELLSSDNEETIVYAMNILNDKKCLKALDKFFDFVVWDYSENVTELATEILSDYPDKISSRAIEAYSEVKPSKRPYLLEILSRVTVKDNRIYEILINEFILNPDKLQLYANYIARYGDERALPVLETAIENDKLDYADFQELKCAIEALGGECNIKRDFSSDKAYLAVKKAKEQVKN